MRTIPASTNTSNLDSTNELLKILKGKRRTIMYRIMDAIIPQGGPFPAGASDFNLAPRVDEIIRSYNPAIVKLFPFMLYYIEFTSLLRTGRPFSTLPTEKASLFLERMEHSRFYYRRMILLMMKLLTYLAFYEIDDVARQIGYEHGCHFKKLPTRKIKSPKKS